MTATAAFGIILNEFGPLTKFFPGQSGEAILVLVG